MKLLSVFVVTLTVNLLTPFNSGAAESKSERVQSATRTPQVIRVGPQGTVKTIAEAARLAGDGDTVEIAAGDYVGDVAVWSQARVRIVASGGRVRITASGAAAEGKAIWVVRGRDIEVEGIEFRGTRVRDRNGAGIRLERGKLTVRNCVFEDNENGILTSNDAKVELYIGNSIFSNNGAGDGQSHNLYVGAIQRLVVKASYFRGARTGHLLKSRARESFVLYSRLTDEAGGSASYELEFPSGGLAVVVGTLIQQGPDTQNSAIVSYGAEGYRWPVNRLYLSHNTLVNDRSAGSVFVAVRDGDVKADLLNNIFVGRGDMKLNGAVEHLGNVAIGKEVFVAPDKFDYRPKRAFRRASPLSDSDVEGVSLTPDREYRHPAATQELPAAGVRVPGAFQTRN